MTLATDCTERESGDSLSKGAGSQWSATAKGPHGAFTLAAVPVPEKPDARDQRYYEITAIGRETLAKARAARGRVTHPLEGFA
jgi:hypothetical protein